MTSSFFPTVNTAVSVNDIFCSSASSGRIFGWALYLENSALKYHVGRSISVAEFAPESAQLREALRQSATNSLRGLHRTVQMLQSFQVHPKKMWGLP